MVYGVLRQCAISIIKTLGLNDKGLAAEPAKAFRGRMLDALEQVGLQSFNAPKKWVVQCIKVGRGLPALKYLSRYLYRGVISNKNLLQDDGTYVTAKYML